MSKPPEDGNPPQAPAVQLVYANASGMRGGPFDLSIEFGYVVPPGEGEAPQPPIWQVRVAMSWEHAQALRDLLDAQLREYQNIVGELPSIEKLKISGEKP
jgi:hypothetical protein